MAELIRKLATFLGAAVFFVAVFILIQWVTMSFIVTGNGPIQWAAGWEAVVGEWLE